jgi:REP element-mobilizing transposase RayT
MIHAYHIIWGTYGFWLPNDPRGSWSEFVFAWELARFGNATRSAERLNVDVLEWTRWKAAAQSALKYPPVSLSGAQARSVGVGFANGVAKSRSAILACSILPQHVHLVIARHDYDAEQIANLLKGEATKQLKRDSLHPHLLHADKRGKLPSVWAEKQWCVFLDCAEAIDGAVQYVEENPEKEGKPKQTWSFVAPYRDVLGAGWISYQ